APASRGKGRARFERGARVRVRRMNPRGHTRCPRYVRGAAGTIEHGPERVVFSAANAHRRGESPQVLFTRGLEAADVWGAGGGGAGVRSTSTFGRAISSPPRARRSAPRRDLRGRGARNRQSCVRGGKDEPRS